MYFLLTNDVEEHSIQKNRLDLDTAKLVNKEGLPRLLKLYDKYNIRTTFYFTASFVELFPESVQKVLDFGHEVGCHGLNHEVEEAFDVLDFGQQVENLRKAKEIIESYAGEIEAFRAPALRINEFTVKALEENNFKTDSSVASQRFDGPFSFGSRKKLNWITASRKPYLMDYNNPFRKGNSKILEIPVSSLVISYIGTTLRILPGIVPILRRMLFIESKKGSKPIVFDFHPNEVIKEDFSGKIEYRAKNIFSIFFKDILRHRLKIRNLGPKAIELMDHEINAAANHGFVFLTVKEFREKWEQTLEQ